MNQIQPIAAIAKTTMRDQYYSTLSHSHRISSARTVARDHTSSFVRACVRAACVLASAHSKKILASGVPCSSGQFGP